MVRKCFVPGCETRDGDLPFHRFPYKKQVALIWMKRFNVFHPFESSRIKNARICDKHFLRVCKSRNNRRLDLALPTLHLPNFNGKPEVNSFLTEEIIRNELLDSTLNEIEQKLDTKIDLEIETNDKQIVSQNEYDNDSILTLLQEDDEKKENNETELSNGEYFCETEDHSYSILSFYNNLKSTLNNKVYKVSHEIPASQLDEENYKIVTPRKVIKNNSPEVSESQLNENSISVTNVPNTMFENDNCTSPIFPKPSCCVCLTESEDESFLGNFDENKVNCKDIYELVKSWLNLEVINDNSKICQICSEQINIISEFYKKCMLSKIILNNDLINKDECILNNNINTVEINDKQTNSEQQCNDNLIIKKGPRLKRSYVVYVPANYVKKIKSQKNNEKIPILKAIKNLEKNYEEVVTPIKNIEHCSEETVVTSQIDETQVIKKETDDNVDNEVSFIEELVKCTICLKVIAAKKYKAHQYAHRYSELGSFLCDVCGKVCKSKRVLYQHRKSKHFNTKKYECQICNKNLKTLMTLKEHIKTVHFRKVSYMCDMCGIGFISKQGFKSHLSRNLCGKTKRLRLYGCGNCYMTNLTKPEYRKHMFDVHGQKIKK